MRGMGTMCLHWWMFERGWEDGDLSGNSISTS